MRQGTGYPFWGGKERPGFHWTLALCWRCTGPCQAPGAGPRKPRKGAEEGKGACFSGRGAYWISRAVWKMATAAT